MCVSVCETTHLNRAMMVFCFWCHLTSIMTELFFAESPAEKRPVVSLMDEEPRPSVSVINIFKQVNRG